MKYFWYSDNQKNSGLYNGDRVFFKLEVMTDDGWKEFTEQNEHNSPSGMWTDYKLVFKSDESIVKYS